jgi:hypothetical protein
MSPTIKDADQITDGYALDYKGVVLVDKASKRSPRGDEQKKYNKIKEEQAGPVQRKRILPVPGSQEW